MSKPSYIMYILLSLTTYKWLQAVMQAMHCRRAVRQALSHLWTMCTSSLWLLMQLRVLETGRSVVQALVQSFCMPSYASVNHVQGVSRARSACCCSISHMQSSAWFGQHDAYWQRQPQQVIEHGSFVVSQLPCNISHNFSHHNCNNQESDHNTIAELTSLVL